MQRHTGCDVYGITDGCADAGPHNSDAVRDANGAAHPSTVTGPDSAAHQGANSGTHSEAIRTSHNVTHQGPHNIPYKGAVREPHRAANCIPESTAE